MWKDLTMQQRAELMDIYLQHGITSLDDIRRDYDLQSSDTVTAYPEDTNDYAHGGSIYIKPSHRGRFTRLKERTGHSASWFKEHGTPAQKKMATFALNAAKWKHGYGGNLFEDGGDLEERPPIVPFTQKEEVIITPDSEYNKYLNTLPDNQRFTSNDKYDSYLYWKLNGKPKNFKEAYNKGMFNYNHSDNGYHANSIAWGEDGIGYFMKPKTHDTVHMETDWFNKGLVTEEGGWQRPETFLEWKESRDFRDNYDLVDDPNRPNFYKYQPKKRALGGNLYDGTSQPTQQMDNSYTYYKPLENIFVDSEGNLRDPEVPRARGSILLPEATAAYPDLKDMAGRYNIASNDAITVANGRPVNVHLRKSVEEGAAKQAAWAQEHPYLNMAGIAAGAAPLAVAFAPAVVGGGELAATTLANPYVDAAITSAFAGHGLNHAINEGIDGYGDAFMTALELTPLGRLAKPVWNTSKRYANNWLKGLEPDIVNITEMNAKSVPLEEWDRQFRAAEAAGDKEKGQRLWDLWYKTKTPGNKAVNSDGKAVESFHTVGDKYDPHFNSFDTNIEGFDSSVYTTDSPFMSGTYSKELTSEAERSHIVEKTREHLVKQYEKNTSDIGKKLYDFYKNHPEQARKRILQDHRWLSGDVNPDRQKRLYTYLREPVEIDAGGNGWSALPLHTLPDDVYKAIKPDMRLDALISSYSTRSLEEAQKAAGHYDGAIVHNVVDYGGAKRYGNMSEPNTVYMVNDPRYVKSAEPFTYADDGSLIDLTDRANFNINDIRYGLLPFLGLGAAGALYGKQE